MSSRYPIAVLGLAAFTLAGPRPATAQESSGPTAALAQPVVRPTISIVAFDTNRTGWVPPPHFGETVADLLTNRLVDSGAFRVFDRSLLPFADQTGRRTSFDEIRELAQHAGVDYVVLGAVTTFSNEKSHKRGGLLGIPFLGGMSKNKQESAIGLTIRVVDIRTGEIVTTTTVSGVGSRDSRTLAGGALIKGLPVGGAFSSGGAGALDRLVASALVGAVGDAAAALTKAAARGFGGQAR